MSKLLDIASVPNKVFSMVFVVHGCVGALERILSHGASLGVVKGGINVQIVEVLGRVFSDTQISDGGPSLGVKLLSPHVSLISILLFILTVVTIVLCPESQ